VTNDNPKPVKLRFEKVNKTLKHFSHECLKCHLATLIAYQYCCVHHYSIIICFRIWCARVTDHYFSIILFLN
jgi:lipopolysaccharide biosynthesis glycosyltransferase